MGEDIQRWQNEQFRHRQDKDFSEFRAKDLFSDRPEVFSRTHSCQLRSGVTIDKNDVLIATCSPDGVHILRGGYELVGETKDPLLVQVLDACHGTHRVELSEISQALSIFTVRVRKAEES